MKLKVLNGKHFGSQIHDLILHQQDEQRVHPSFLQPGYLFRPRVYNQIVMKKILVGLVLIVVGLGGTLLWSQEWQQVAVLAADTNSGETLLSVKWTDVGTVDSLLLIESRDGSISETHEVVNIYGNNIILKDRLRADYLADSVIFQ